MDLKLLWLICLSTYLCSLNYHVQSATIKPPINGLNSSSSPSSPTTPITPTTKPNSSITYELLSTTSTEHEESIGQLNGKNKTINGQLNGKDILNGQEQRQNQFTQERGPPNRFPPQFQGNNYNYGPQLGNYQLQGLSRPRQPNFVNQINQRGPQQLTNPYDILNGIIPPSGQNGFHTRTPQQQQQQQQQQPLNQPVNSYPIANNYPGLNPNQLYGNVGDKSNNQGYGLSDNPSDGYNDQSSVTESPGLGEQGDGVDEGTENENGEENVGDNGESDGGNEEVTPNEEGESTDEPNDETVNDEGGVNGKGNEGDENAQFDDAASTNDQEGDAEETANSDEATDADGAAGQGGGEQDPSNDPDLAQFQNLQGGNFPGDLFPPGILSQQDLNEIQKSIEEQQKKEAEKQANEEETAADQNEGGEDGTGEENTGNDEGSEGGGETDQPEAAPPAVNPYIPVAGYGRPINDQANLLNINRALAGRTRNPGLMGRPFNPPVGQRDSPNGNRYGGRGDFGTGIQDYEYERPKVNQEEDEVPNRLRYNPLFNRNRPFYSNNRGTSGDDDDDEEDDKDERIHPPYIRNRFPSRFDRFRPRLFSRPGRYNNDLGDYGVHRSDSNQHPRIDYESNKLTSNYQSSSNDNIRNQIKLNDDNQSIINYENEDQK